MLFGIRIVSRFAVSLLLIISISMLALADTIRLKDGSIIKGRIVGFAGGKFTVAIGEGSRLKQMTFLAADIDSIVFDSPIDKTQNSAGNRSVTDGGKIVNASSTTSTPPKVIVTDSSVRSNGSATIGSSVPIRQKVGNQDRSADQKIGDHKTSGNAPSAAADPISWNVKVLADNTANGWTNTGWVVKKGQRIHITGDGQVSLGKGKTSPASGVDIQDDMKLLKNVPTGALIAVIGDDNNDFIYIGAEREFTATRDGALFLGINEGSLEDNSGSFNVKVEILPDN